MRVHYICINGKKARISSFEGKKTPPPHFRLKTDVMKSWQQFADQRGVLFFFHSWKRICKEKNSCRVFIVTKILVVMCAGSKNEAQVNEGGTVESENLQFLLGGS